MTCPSCDEEVYAGVNITFLEHQGLPVVPVSMFEQEKFMCECGARIYTGELDFINEAEEDDD